MGANQAIALMLTLVVHLIAVGVLVAILLHSDEDCDPGGWRRWLRPDGPAPQPPIPPDPDGVALPRDAAQGGSLRLRDHGRLADAHEAPPRRPRHAPVPAHTPAGDPARPERG